MNWPRIRRFACHRRGETQEIRERVRARLVTSSFHVCVCVCVRVRSDAGVTHATYSNERTWSLAHTCTRSCTARDPLTGIETYRCRGVCLQGGGFRVNPAHPERPPPAPSYTQDPTLAEGTHAFPCPCLRNEPLRRNNERFMQFKPGIY